MPLFFSDRFLKHIELFLLKFDLLVKDVFTYNYLGICTGRIINNNIIINPNDLNLKKHMTVYGSTRYILKDNNENGKIGFFDWLKHVLRLVNPKFNLFEPLIGCCAMVYG